AFVLDDKTHVNHSWFRGGWWDPLSMAWNDIEQGNIVTTKPIEKDAPGASLYVPFTLPPSGEKTITLLFSWYVPHSDIKIGKDEENTRCEPGSSYCDCDTFKPWYSKRFNSIEAVASYWRENYQVLKQKSTLFKDAFYESTLPAEVLEAVAANLTILKSPTVLRQTDGNLWNYEGCGDSGGCCHGSCTHVWNYAQAIPHLFPSLERTLRETEFRVSQDGRGHQTFRTSLPIRKTAHDFHAAADGQLGGIMKVYREWRISGDTEWMKALYPFVKSSLDYCIETWDPAHKGILEEPHHNTYDIEFWGPDGMCTSFYLGALTALVEMAKAAKQQSKFYEKLLKQGKKYMEEELFDGEYFIHKIQWTGLRAQDPSTAPAHTWTNYSEDAIELLKKEGPKYQYGKGCLSDGILGMWIASVCGLPEVIDQEKVTSHLKAIHTYNLKEDLRDHPNPQRPAYALGREGGLLLCTWPKGGKLSLPFVYSNEVWTGIEYQVASHLMLKGKVKEGLDIVQMARKRYDGKIRNPFNEYECGHWYARALASYGLIQGLTGARYDAVEKTLYIDSKIGNDFVSFISTETGFGHVGLKGGKPFVEMKNGNLHVEAIYVSGVKTT
ncbi:MAG: non-lysosomal glucosylceramidase, partial [Cyclobacteriaceae bacterium]|nr:non-lysosomal glucosylceramidase [Cyclobacteriaceae bacterium]